MNGLKRMATKIATVILKRKEKVATAGLAYTFDYCVDWLFHYPLYIWVINEFGLKKGFVVMSCLSFLLCYVYIKIYDAIKRDLFLLEDAKKWMETMATYAGKSKTKLLRAKIIRKGGIVVSFLILSLWRDPFYTLVFCRQEQYSGFFLKEWGIFLGSVVVGNAIWALSVFGGIEVFKMFLK